MGAGGPQASLNLSVCWSVLSHSRFHSIQGRALFTADNPSYRSTMDVAASSPLQINTHTHQHIISLLRRALIFIFTLLLLKPARF